MPEGGVTGFTRKVIGVFKGKTGDGMAAAPDPGGQTPASGPQVNDAVSTDETPTPEPHLDGPVHELGHTWQQGAALEGHQAAPSVMGGIPPSQGGAQNEMKLDDSAGAGAALGGPDTTDAAPAGSSGLKYTLFQPDGTPASAGGEYYVTDVRHTAGPSGASEPPVEGNNENFSVNDIKGAPEAKVAQSSGLPDSPSLGAFQEAEGLDSELTVAEYRDGGPPQGGADSHPDFAWVPTRNPAAPEFGEKAQPQAEGTATPEDRISDWDKSQELAAGKVMQTDYNFETPHGATDGESSTYIRMAQPAGGGVGEDSKGLWQINVGADQSEAQTEQLELSHQGFLDDTRAGGPGVGVLKSTDGGKTWQADATGTDNANFGTPVDGPPPVTDGPGGAPPDDSASLVTGPDPRGWDAGKNEAVGGEGGAPEAAKFEISSEGHQSASFSELQGITTKVDTVDYVETNEQLTPADIAAVEPGSTEYPNVSFYVPDQDAPLQPDGAPARDGFYESFAVLGKNGSDADAGGVDQHNQSDLDLLAARAARLPDKDDEALANLEQGEPDKPYVLGRVYNPDEDAQGAGGMPAKVEAPDLSGKSGSDVAMESITIQHEGIDPPDAAASGWPVKWELSELDTSEGSQTRSLGAFSAGPAGPIQGGDGHDSQETQTAGGGVSDAVQGTGDSTQSSFQGWGKWEINPGPAATGGVEHTDNWEESQSMDTNTEGDTPALEFTAADPKTLAPEAIGVAGIGGVAPPEPDAQGIIIHGNPGLQPPPEPDTPAGVEGLAAIGGVAPPDPDAQGIIIHGTPGLQAPPEPDKPAGIEGLAGIGGVAPPDPEAQGIIIHGTPGLQAPPEPEAQGFIIDGGKTPGASAPPDPDKLAAAGASAPPEPEAPPVDASMTGPPNVAGQDAGIIIIGGAPGASAPPDPESPPPEPDSQTAINLATPGASAPPEPDSQASSLSSRLGGGDTAIQDSEDFPPDEESSTLLDLNSESGFVPRFIGRDDGELQDVADEAGDKLGDLFDS